MSTSVERLAYGYELMHRAICNMAGTSGADGRWYFDRANEVLKRVSPVFSVGPESNPHKPGDCLSGYKEFCPPTPSQYIPPNIGPHDESVAAVVEIDWSKPIVVVYPDGNERQARVFPPFENEPDEAGQYHVDFGDRDMAILYFNRDGSGWGYAKGAGLIVRNGVAPSAPAISTRTPSQSSLIAQLVEALEASKSAMDEYYRYWTGGETRGSYDGKPERSALWKAREHARTALAAARGEG